MKILATFMCVSIICVLTSGAPSIRDIHNECQADPATHLDNTEFTAIHEGQSFDRVKVGAHILCMSTKIGTQNQDGSINRTAVKDLLALKISDKATLEEVTNKCMEEGPTPSETAIKLSKCITENTRRQRHGTGHHHRHYSIHRHEHINGRDHHDHTVYVQGSNEN